MSTASHTPEVLTLSGLRVTYAGRTEPAVDGIDLSLAAGETLALVGESGSGKSTTAQALAGLLESASVSAEAHKVLGHDVRTATVAGGRRRPSSGPSVTPASWRSLRGSGVGYVPQDAGTGLNPVRTVGSQLGQVVRQARGDAGRRGRDDVAARVREALHEVGLEPAHGARYPHELSGGQRQRILIALALIGRPRLVVADEPTSALDVTVQKQVLDLLEALVRDTGAALVLITHDLGVAADRADRIAVMNSGRIVETGTARDVLEAPREDYTKRLVAAAPSVALLHQAAPMHVAAAPEAGTGAAPLVLRATGLVKEFGGGRANAVRAVDDVDLELRRGHTLGIVGESGSGKSTAARLLLGLTPADAGRVELLGRELDGSRAQFRQLAQRARLVYQDPSASLDPRRSVEFTIAEPLRGFKVGDRRSRAARVRELLDLVALPHSVLASRPGEISGGQRQRVAIARALAVSPELVVLDEPVSALDVSVQAQILQLLADLQRELDLSYVFISHDLAVVREISDEVAVMADGRVVETGPANAVFAHPQHELTRRLLDAVPGAARARELAAA